MNSDVPNSAYFCGCFISQNDRATFEINKEIIRRINAELIRKNVRKRLP